MVLFSGIELSNEWEIETSNSDLLSKLAWHGLFEMEGSLDFDDPLGPDVISPFEMKHIRKTEEGQIIAEKHSVFGVAFGSLNMDVITPIDPETTDLIICNCRISRIDWNFLTTRFYVIDFSNCVFEEEVIIDINDSANDCYLFFRSCVFESSMSFNLTSLKNITLESCIGVDFQIKDCSFKKVEMNRVAFRAITIESNLDIVQSNIDTFIFQGFSKEKLKIDPDFKIRKASLGIENLYEQCKCSITGRGPLLLHRSGGFELTNSSLEELEIFGEEPVCPGR